MTAARTYLNELHAMSSIDISAVAVKYLDTLLQRCTIHLVCDLTGISRTTLYKWLDEDVELEAMNHRDAAWFILLYETMPKMQMLVQRGPLTNPRLAKRVLEQEK